ncbi:MAG: T9SS type A sorting domain-containing protein [Saprospiraceae bacterium]|nr:T9SS type A sorting domain-containing protein [Saprospiraceae bacterium]
MKKIVFLLAACCFAMGAASSQTITGSIQHDGIQRNYRLHLPPNLPQGSQPPLVFNLHGFTSNAQQQELYSGMNAVADTAGFIVCYPDGIGNAWNIGVPGGSTADDMGFIAALIDKFHAENSIDLERVYSCGMSNGGFFSYRLACEMGDRFAAIASVTGSMTTAMLNDCNPVRPMPVLEIHGDADPVVNYNGALGNAAVPDVFNFWADKNGCLQPGNNGNIPDTNPNDQCTASFESYFACNDTAEVILITVHNGGHTWPGAFPTVVFGATCQDFDASREIWLFFRKHQLELTSATADIAAQQADFQALPNPFDDNLKLSLRSKPVQFARVFDAMGRQVWAGKCELGINTQDWQKGIYFIVAESDGRLFNCKAVKQ